MSSIKQPKYTPHSFFFGEATISLNGDPVVKLGERSWAPDQTTAYVKFELSFAFPNVNSYGEGIHASVVARSYLSMNSKPANSNHRMIYYGDTEDAILGTVVGVEFPEPPTGGWATPKEKSAAPFITGVAAIWLNAAPATTWIERYKTKRKKVAVSMEVLYALNECGFAVARSGDTRIEGAETPLEFWNAGWEYVPMTQLLPEELLDGDLDTILGAAAKAPKDSLLRTRDWKNKRMIGGSLLNGGLEGNWKGRKVYFMQGGVNHQVHYPGFAFVEQGAEPRAAIETMLASDVEASQFVESLEGVTNVMQAFVSHLEERKKWEN